MKFGISLPHSGPLAAVGAIRQVATQAEQLGYESVWVHDHITYDLDWLGHRTSGVIEDEALYQPDFYESISTLAYVAGFTQRVNLGTAIIVLPLRDPRVLARQALTIQSLSGGRLVLGFGTGDYPADFQVMGIPSGHCGCLPLCVRQTAIACKPRLSDIGTIELIDIIGCPLFIIWTIVINIKIIGPLFQFWAQTPGVNESYTGC